MRAASLPFSLSFAAAVEPIDSEQQLVRQCRAGKRRAQHEFYRRYAQAMYNVCLRILNHEAEAEDVLQEAFLKAFQNIHRFKGESTVGAWLKRIVVNTALNQLRRRKIDWVSLEEHPVEPPENTAATEENLPFSVPEIRAAIRELPDGYRVVFSLYLLEGYDHQEIASILDISESTSKSQYNRAKKRLRQLLTTH